MNSLLSAILILTVASSAAMGAKIPTKKRGLEESLAYNQQNQLILLPSHVNHVQPYGIEANVLQAQTSSEGHNLNLLGEQLQDYSSSSFGNTGYYTALQAPSNIVSGNTPQPPAAPVSAPASTTVSQQVHSQPQPQVVQAGAPDPASLFTAARPATTTTVAAAPATLTVPAVASATLQLQVPAQVQTIQTSSVQQQSAPAPVQTASVVQNVERSSVNTQQVQQQAQTTQQNVQQQPTQAVSSPQQQGFSYGNIQNLQLNQVHGGFDQNTANLVQTVPSYQSTQLNQAHGGFAQNTANLVQANPSVQLTQQTFPLNQQHIGFQQGLSGSSLDQKSLLGSYNLNHQILPGLEYASLNSGFDGLNFNANLLSYKGY